jgi:drug/metabolite transporter (DMT)-like permease
MVGELAAVLTSVMWSLTSVQFTLAGREIGSQNVNRLRLVAAACLLAVFHLVVYGTMAPVGADWRRWGWLGASGIVGLVLGDSMLFQAFVLIGPRQAMLLMTMAPIIGAVLAWAWLGETLGLTEVVAVGATVGGIAWVVAERNQPRGERDDETRSDQARLTGILMGLGGAIGQAVGLVLAKQGLRDSFPALSATLMRMLVASVTIWLIAAAGGRVQATIDAARHGENRRYILGGAITGPTAGVWLSMVAVQYAPVGIASALMALPPIILIPLARWVFHEQISRRAVAGTVVALCGAAALFIL